MNPARDWAGSPVAGRVAVVGVGNVLMGDDGFGPFVVRQLEACYDYPDEVTITDAGTPGFDLLLLFDEAAAVVVVDTIALPDPPGTLRLLEREELMSLPVGLRLSPHSSGLAEALQMLEFRGGGPSAVRLVGVVPQRCDLGLGLSPPVRAAVPLALTTVVEQLRLLGVAIKEREQPREAEIWWEMPGHRRGGPP